MRDKKFYIYIYYNKQDEVIYVGLTSRPLKRRVKEHEIEPLQKETDHIDYSEVGSEADMRMYELFYINKFNPKFNTRDLYKDGVINANLPELIFIPFLGDDMTVNTNIKSDANGREYRFTCKSGRMRTIIENPYEKTGKEVQFILSGRPRMDAKTLSKYIEQLQDALEDIMEK